MSNTNSLNSPIHDTYPAIVSKMDPLIIRVEPLVLLVGTTTYSAKIKIGKAFTGFHIYNSGLGEPIYKVDMNDVYADNDSNYGMTRSNPAYDTIYTSAVEWMDIFENQYKETKEKNIVDLLREIKFQMHYDLSGHVGNASEYPNLEMCTETPTYIHDILRELTELNVGISNLTAVINGGDLKQVVVSQSGTDIHVETVGTVTNSINNRLNTLEETLDADIKSTNTNIDNVKSSIDAVNSTLSNDLPDISSKIQAGYQTVADAVGTMNTHIGKFVDDNGNLQNQAATMYSNVSDIKSDMSTVNTNVGIVKQEMDTLYDTIYNTGGTNILQYIANKADTIDTTTATILEATGRKGASGQADITSYVLDIWQHTPH